jgi:hypothetical protein
MTRNIKTRRKLSDLYVTGVEVRFDRTGGRIGPFTEAPLETQVQVWVQPPNPLQREMSMRAANAASAKAMLKLRRKDETSEEYATALAFVAEMSDETLVDYLLQYENDRRETDAQREVLALPEWEDFGALQDAMREWEESGEDEDDPEYADLMEADKRFGSQVNQRYGELYDSDREGLSLLNRDALEQRAIEKRGELVKAQVFMNEYQRQMSFYAVRDFDDKDQCFFESAREFANQPDQVQLAIQEALSRFIGDASDPSGSLEEGGGSPPSPPPSEPETSEASIPEELSA